MFECIAGVKNVSFSDFANVLNEWSPDLNIIPLTASVAVI